MKNCILKGVCVFFLLSGLLLLSASVIVSAQSGHGGRTEVIARIESEPSAESEESQPLSTPPESEPSDTTTVQTGEMIAWYAVFILFISGGTMVLLWSENDESNE